MEQRSVIGLTVAMLAALAVMVGLGVWQLNRLQWKQDLIAQIEARSSAAPITLAEAEALAASGRDPSYYRIAVDGRFHHGKEHYLYTVSEGRVGWHVITPLETADGEIVLVDRGFVPEQFKDPAARAAGQIDSVTAVTGIVRAPDLQGLFTPDNEPGANRWFWRDLKAMSRSMFPEGMIDLSPFFIEADKLAQPGGWPEGGQTRLDIPNNHLQYAITWFLLAAGLVVVYALFLRGQHRRETL